MKQSNRPTVDELLEQHQQPLQPKRDLWPGIERSLSAQPQPRGSSWRTSWPMLLASAAMLMLTLVIWQQGSWQAPPQNNSASSASWQLVQLLNQQHQQQTELLQSKFQQAGYQPLNTTSSSDLKRLREASQAITDALANDPANPELIRLLQWVHQQEIALMDTAYVQQKPWRQL